jgi:hypothetical protein
VVRYAETPVSWAMRKFRVSPVTGVEPNPPEISGVDDIKYTPQSPYWWHNFVLSGGIDCNRHFRVNRRTIFPRLQSIEMPDALYLSMWYPNLRLAALPDKLVAVLSEFAQHGGEALVYSATVWPVSWSESPVFQQVYGRRLGGPNQAGKMGAEPRAAVEEGMELIHDDYAYEFQIGWDLWELEAGSTMDHKHPGLVTRWVRGPRLVRVIGFGPLFDEGSYEQEGHIRIDFGSDTPFLEEEAELDSVAARHIEQNVRQLVDLTAGVEKASGATARLLWSELGESLAQRLAARLGQRN